jgi:hypothetical protein
MALSPVINLPVRSQVLGIDVESVAPVKGFAQDAFDVANVNGVLVVENPTEGDLRLVLPFPVEEASAEVRIVSTGERKEFRKRDGRAEQFVELLRSIGEIPTDQEPILKEVLAAIKEFRVADVHIPAGTQILRFHARQILRPVGGDTRSYELEFFAPLAGFVLAPSGQSQMSVTVAFPPAWAAPGMSIGTPVITPLPGQAAPPEQPSWKASTFGPCCHVAVRALAMACVRVISRPGYPTGRPPVPRPSRRPRTLSRPPGAPRAPSTPRRSSPGLESGMLP